MSARTCQPPPTGRYIRTKITSGGLGMILLDRPASLNALDVSMVEDMYDILMAWKNPGHSGVLSSPKMPCAVMIMSWGAYERYVHVSSSSQKKPYFCAGGDVKQVVERGLKNNDVAWGLRYFTREYFLDFLISRYPLPYISLMDGITFGGGVGLSIHGRYQVATENTIFAMPECAIGLFPDIGGSYFLPRLHGGLGMYLGLTGARLYGHEVKRAGLATHYIHSSLLPYLLQDLEKELEDSRRIHTNPNIPDSIVRSVLNMYDEKTRDGDKTKSVGHPSSRVFDYQDEIDEVFGWKQHGRVEDIVDACEERAKTCAFFQDALHALAAASPLSLKLTFQQLRMGRTMPLAECFRLDNRIIRRLTEDTTSDFYIGVENKLLRKSDRPPLWNRASLAEVNDALVEAYVQPLPRPADELQLQSWITKL